MKVTKINYFVQDRRNWSYPLARCSVVLDDVLRLNGISIYEGVNGKYISFPSRKDAEKESQKTKNEIYHPVEKEFADYLKNVIIEGYQKMLENKTFSYIPDEGKLSDYNVETDE